MLKKSPYKEVFRRFFTISLLVCGIFIFFWIPSSAQTKPDSSSILKFPFDTTKVKTVENKNSSALDAPVTYSATDSMVFDVAEEKIYLYGNAEVNYENINLKAAYIELSMNDNIAFAKGMPDSTGKIVGKPEFSEADSKFRSETMRYNFDTKKGLITDVLTQQGDGYIHGSAVKKSEKEEYYIKDGKYTTCNDERHPHFYIRANKLKVIPDDKIVTGPAELYILDIPTPLMVPFGFFPNKKGRKSGFLMPAPGETQNLGFFLKDGGYYWGISDKVDLTFRGDIYSRGSYRVSGMTNYNTRYKYNGYLMLGYSNTKLGEKEFINYSENKNYNFVWRHNQDPKAHPNRTFAADVNVVSSKYNQFNTTAAQQVLNNTFQSNIVYSKRFPNSPFNFTANASQNQNTLTRDVNFVLPGAALTMNTIYPFKSKNSVGNKWYQTIGMSYTTDVKNQIRTKDTLMKYLLIPDTLYRRMDNGMQHNINTITSFKALKFVSVSPSISYNEKWYMRSYTKDFVQGRNYENTADSNYVNTDTIRGFASARNISFNVSTTTKLYGMLQFKQGPIKAIRHVLTPQLGFTYIPVLKQNPFGRYGDGGRGAFYDPLQGSIYGGFNQTETGNINFGFINNLEAKVKSRKDTLTGIKKIKLFENLSINASYNILADTLNWSQIRVNARTYLFDKINITANANFDPYAYNDSTGSIVNRSEYSKSGNYARLASATVGFNFDMHSKKKDNPTTPDSPEYQAILNNPKAYVDFNVPWNLSVSYSFTYTEQKKLKSVMIKSSIPPIVQTVRFYGDFNLTSKWKIGFNSGLDVVTQKLTYTTLNIYRDLHCWEMAFNWIPFGQFKSYSFDINVKSGTLQDLKLSRRRSWYDLR